jgi:glycosyltransferase involved in cell wall biosynthesis
MKKPNKILIVDFNGTSPTYTHYFSLALEDKGYELNILGHKNTMDLEVHNKTLNYVGFKLRNKLVNYLCNWFFLIVNAKSYNVIHIQWLPFLKHSVLDLWGIYVLKNRNRNIFYTVHNLYPHDETKEKTKRRFNKLYDMLENIVVHTNTTTENLRKLGYNRNIIEIKHGLFYKGLNKKNGSISNKMVMLGRICEYKGYEEALRALKVLIDEGANFSLHIEGAGSFNYVLKLESLIKELNIEDRVILKYGYIDTSRLIELYCEAFVALMPYKEIDQSGVVFTAFGLNIPVVANNVGGLKDIVQDKVNGRLVEQGNLREFVESIKWVYNNQTDLKNELLKNEYSHLWQQSADILSKYYNKI